MGVSPDKLKLLEMVKKNFMKIGETLKTLQTGDLSIPIVVKFVGDTNILKINLI